MKISPAEWLKIKKQGYRAWKKNSRFRDCPYTLGTDQHQAWINGYGDASDEAIVKYFKKTGTLPFNVNGS